MLIAKTLGLAKANAVDDGGMIEFVADNGVLFVIQRFKNTPVGVECGHVQDSVFSAQEFRQFSFQLFMYILRAADKAYTTHAISPAVDVLFGRLYHFGMRRKTEVVIG